MQEFALLCINTGFSQHLTDFSRVQLRSDFRLSLRYALPQSSQPKYARASERRRCSSYKGNIFVHPIVWVGQGCDDDGNRVQWAGERPLEHSK